MKKIAILSLLTFALTGCNQTARQTANTNASMQTSDNSTFVSGHSQGAANNLSGVPQTSASVVPKSETRTKWKQTGTPIDTGAFDAEIAEAEKNLKAKSKGETAKRTLADAYLKRAMALTQAGQYASALGDYRRVLKYDASNGEAQTWITKIIELYDGMNKEYPKEGEEPPALPFRKEV